MSRLLTCNPARRQVLVYHDLLGMMQVCSGSFQLFTRLPGFRDGVAHDVPIR